MAAVGTMAYPARGAFQTSDPYTSYSHRPARHSPALSDTQSYHSSYAAPTPSLRHYQISPAHSPRTSRPSTAGDESRPSLPSISNLLGIADRDRNSHRAPAHQPSVTSHPSHSLPAAISAKHDSGHDHAVRSFGSPYEQRSIINDGLPPTPPRSEAAYGAGLSPGTLSTASSFTQSAIAAPSGARLDVGYARTPVIPPSPHGLSPSSSPRYTTSSTGSPSGAYYSTAPAPSTTYGQRALPTNFPPPPPPVSHALAQSPMHTNSTHNPWEHHHYISPSSQATFPQTQDRYICQACSKAFSRPSSLKIHSHSHTGEKPFKCPHAGCDKAFSVRSNMKRHERGCHAGMAAMASAVRLR